MVHQGGKKVLVYGADGVQGGAVVRRLLETGRAVRGLVHAERGAEALRGSGAEPAFGDLSDPKSLREATEGCDAVFLVLPLEYEREKVLAWMKNVPGSPRLDRSKTARGERVPDYPGDAPSPLLTYIREADGIGLAAGARADLAEIVGRSSTSSASSPGTFATLLLVTWPGAQTSSARAPTCRYCST
jgi:hypothetical protein